MLTRKENRPLVHFTPKTGWINDPNGMVYIDGVYHLFFQHYPDGVTWGPMHWGHAISTDLLHWEELPIAIYPDELGVIFSGSCFYDKRNLSGLGTKDIPMLGVKGHAPLIAMYTSHYMGMTEDGKRIDKETQSIAYSTDLIHFEKHIGNPVIGNESKKDFRDPKVFWNPMKECFSMVLAAGKCVEFYASPDLKKWSKTGEFEAGINGMNGTCECPDCFPVIAEDGTEKWVLFISMIVPEDKVGTSDAPDVRMTHISQYYVGDFDGETFHDTEKASETLLLDYGTDNYAPVTFQNLDEKVMIGWGHNWGYARTCVTGEYNGRMTLARKMGLKKTAEGYRLCYTFEGLDAAKTASLELKAGKNRLRLDTFGIQVTEGTTGAIILSNENKEELVIRITEDEIIVDRRNAGKKGFHELFDKDSISVNRAPRKCKDDAALDLVWDRSFVEVLADQGMAGFAVVAYPEYLYDTITIQGDLRAKIYELK